MSEASLQVVPVCISKNLIDYCLNPSDLDRLDQLNSLECRQILPFLSRLWVRNSFVDELNYGDFKMGLMDKLRLYEDTNRILNYLGANFTQIYEDVIRHLSTRKKTQTLSVYSYNDFETGSALSKILMVSNILLNGNIRNEENIACKYSSIDYSLFDFEIYYQDLSDLLCIIHAELGEVISLSQFVYTLLHIQSPLSVNYILNLIANSIDSIFQIVDILLEGCSCNSIDVQRHKCLISISSFWPTLNNYIINECIRRHQLPSVILCLARQDSLILTLLSVFQFETDRNWFVQFLRSPNKNSIEKQSVDLIREDLVALCYVAKSTPHLDLQLFKLYSALRIFAGLKFNEAEIKALIELIVNSNEINIGTCFLIIYPPLYENEANFQRVIDWLRASLPKAKQSLLLISNYCSSYQSQLLNEYASNLIGFKFQLKNNSFALMTRVFQNVFQDDGLLDEYMHSLPITPNLRKSTKECGNNNGSNLNSSDIYFLNQWIKTSSSFLNKRNFDLNNWLCEQIKQCGQPLHPIIVSLINTYVNQLFNINIINENRLTPFSSQLILDFLRQNYHDYDLNLAPKILFFYYLLLFESKRREAILTLSSANNANNQNNNSNGAPGNNANGNYLTQSRVIGSSLESILSHRYSSEIYEYIPVNYILLKAKEADFFQIYPSLLRLVINIFTQLCQVEHSLELSTSISKTARWTNLNYTTNKLRELKQSILTDQITRNDVNMFKSIWLKAYAIHGRKLSLQTASIVLDLPKLTYEDMYSNPLILLKTDDMEIYKCGPLFEIVLYLVRECLIASRNQMELYIVENHLAFLNDSKATNQIKAIKDRQELKTSLVVTQDSAVIQILLDVFLLIKQKSNEMITREIQCIICSFIHQMFIENTNLAELVHFQGYSKSLIPVLVEGVPSMHICLDFAPKLLANNDLEKQIFAISLVAELCKKYPIVKTYNVAKLAINVAFTLVEALTLPERKKFFAEIAPSLVVFYTKLPPLTNECMSLIMTALQTKSIDVDSLPFLVKQGEMV